MRSGNLRVLTDGDHLTSLGIMGKRPKPAKGRARVRSFDVDFNLERESPGQKWRRKHDGFNLKLSCFNRLASHKPRYMAGSARLAE